VVAVQDKEQRLQKALVAQAQVMAVVAHHLLKHQLTQLCMVQAVAAVQARQVKQAQTVLQA
jgi:hypothetical protein